MAAWRMQARKGYALLFGLALLAASCDGDDSGAAPDGGETTGEASSSEVIENARESGSIKVGTIVTPPWVMRAPGEEEYEGPEPLYIEKIAEELGVEIEWVESSWETIIQGLESRQFDIAAAPLNPSPEREQVADFAVFTEAGYCYLVGQDSEITTIEDIDNAGVDIATPAGTALIGLMEENFPEANVNAVSLPPGANVNVEDVLTGRHDVTIINSPEVYAYENQFGDDLRVIPSGDECFNSPHLSTPIGVAIRKEDPELLALLERVYEENAEEIEAEDRKATESMSVEG